MNAIEMLRIKDTEKALRDEIVVLKARITMLEEILRSKLSISYYTLEELAAMRAEGKIDFEVGHDHEYPVKG